jgi:hypothetical protein
MMLQGPRKAETVWRKAIADRVQPIQSGSARMNARHASPPDTRRLMLPEVSLAA